MRKKRRRLSLEIFGESFRDGSRRVLGAGARRLLRANDTCERLDVITIGSIAVAPRGVTVMCAVSGGAEPYAIVALKPVPNDGIQSTVL